MARAIANSLLSLLLLVTLVWGGCISCKQYFMAGAAKRCCTPNGRCKTTLPSKLSDSGYKQIAVHHHKPAALSVDLKSVAALKIAVPEPAGQTVKQRVLASRIDPSPPDLQILHSTFLV